MKKIALIFVIFVSFSGGFMISAQNGQFKPKYKANWNGIDGKISKYVQNHISENGTYTVSRLGDGKTHIVSVLIVGAGNFQMKFDNKPGNRSPNNLNWGDLNPEYKLWRKGEAVNWIDGGDGYDYLIDVFLSFCGNTGTVRRPNIQNIEPKGNLVNGGNHDTIDNPNIIIEGDDSDNGVIVKGKSKCNNNGGIQLQHGDNNPTISGGGFGENRKGNINDGSFPEYILNQKPCLRMFRERYGSKYDIQIISYYENHKKRYIRKISDKDAKNDLMSCLGIKNTWKVVGICAGSAVITTGIIFLIRAILVNNREVEPVGPTPVNSPDIPGPPVEPVGPTG